MKKIVIVSPEIPYPVFKGNQNRISLTIEALLELDAEVHLACLNSSQRVRTSKEVVNDLMGAYPRLSSAMVRRHPRMGKPRYRVRHAVLKKVSSVPNNPFQTEDSCPANFRKACRNLIRELNPDLVLVNYIKLSGCIPDRFEGVKVVDLHDVQSNILKADKENKGGMSQSEYMQHLQAEVRLIDSYCASPRI
ncbi:hypothetical protein P4C99_21590 [Pontiellaceae bacterium B1224]|nr:hypothetical protein [Pontiellaceae bacterium B1224]